MQNLRALRQRIRSVQNTQKITRAMQMVAGAKLRRQQEELMAFRPYATQLDAITRRFLGAHPDLEHPVILRQAQDDRENDFSVRGEPVEPRMDETPPPIGLVIHSSDTGLCGTYNERVLDAALGFIRENPSISVVSLGKKGTRLLAHRGIKREREILDWGGRYDPARAVSLLQWMKELYLNGSVSAWWVATTQFASALRWKPVVEPFLPMPRPAQAEISEKVIVEPDLKSVTEDLFSRRILAQWKRILLEAFTSEHSARMIAMKNATDNAGEMIDTLTLVRNKARQAAITKELIEVVSGAEAIR